MLGRTETKGQFRCPIAVTAARQNRLLPSWRDEGIVKSQLGSSGRPPVAKQGRRHQIWIVIDVGGRVSWNIFRPFSRGRGLGSAGIGAGVLCHETLLQGLVLGTRLARSGTGREQRETEQANGDRCFHL